MAMKLSSGKFKPGDHVLVMVPDSKDLIEAHIMFENVGGYMLKSVRPHSTYPDERHHWTFTPSNTFFSRHSLDQIDCSEDLLLPYGLGAIVLFTGKGGVIR